MSRLPAALRGLIFDCDGVLFDSKDANTAYYNRIRQGVLLPPMTPAEAADSHMLSTDQALERMIPAHLQQQAAQVRDSLRYSKTFMPFMTPSPHVYECLQTLTNRGLKLALYTNRSDSVHEVLSHFAMPFFSPVMTISHMRPKPDPQGLLAILDEWGMAPGDVAFIGDSPVDQEASDAAGVAFWSFNNPALTAQLHCNCFKTLEDMLVSAPSPCP